MSESSKLDEDGKKTSSTKNCLGLSKIARAVDTIKFSTKYKNESGSKRASLV